jgi:hypothetical protein
MSYIITLPNDELTSQERAQLITRELYNITAPEAKQHDYQADGTVFGVIAHPDGDQHALQVDLDFVIYCSPDVDLTRLVSAFPEVPAEEKAGLEALIENSTSITFGQIIPSTATVRDYQYMVDHGWFPEPETL